MRSVTWALTERFHNGLASLIPKAVHPNAISLFGAACAYFTSFLVQVQLLRAAAFFYTLYMVADNLDGLHARCTKQTSAFGHALDHFVDGLAGLEATFSITLLCFDTTDSQGIAAGRHLMRAAFLSSHIHAIYTKSLLRALRIPGTRIHIHVDDVQIIFLVPLLCPSVLPMQKLSLQHPGAWVPWACLVLVILANIVCILVHAMRGKGSKLCHGMSLAFLSWVTMASDYSTIGYVTLLAASLALFHHDI